MLGVPRSSVRTPSAETRRRRRLDVVLVERIRALIARLSRTSRGYAGQKNGAASHENLHGIDAIRVARGERTAT